MLHTAAVLAAVAGVACACSNLLVSPGATVDGSAILAYNADDMGLFGSLDLRPAANHTAGAMRNIWDWDDQLYTGAIPEVNHTYNVVGNINEWGVVITETTFGGRGDLAGQGTGAIMSYGDLMFTTLSRAKTAREAIQVMDYLCQKYGYESSGESFGVGDPTEVWLMELIGKGKYATGAVWVASKIPAGYVTGTANQARHRTFNQSDPDNVLFSSDVISFARSIGAWNGSDEDFDFQAAYDPISFSGARFCEARVWSLLNPACGGCLDGNLDYVQGYNLSNPMPLFVPVAKPLTLNDTFALMRNHFEGTWFDNTGLVRADVGAGQGNSPYRFRPLMWAFNQSSYLNERTVGVQQSGWAFIAHLRSWLPNPIKTVMWFAPDDSSTSPRIPVYGCATAIPASFGDLVGQTPGGGVSYAPVADAYTMNLQSAFWVWNLVGNIAFSERYGSALPLLQARLYAEQDRMFADAAQAETDFQALYSADPAGAIAFITNFMVSEGQDMTTRWTNFWMYLFATFRDGGILLPSTSQQCQGSQTDNCVAKLQPVDQEIGYTQQWRARIVGDSDNAEHYLVPPSSATESTVHYIDKVTLAEGKLRRAKLARIPMHAKLAQQQ